MRNPCFLNRFEGLESRHALDGDPVLLADLAPGPASSDPAEFLGASGHVFFVAKQDGGGTGLWRSDGAGAATPLAGLTLGNGASIAEMGGNVYATAFDASRPGELVRVDGATSAITTLYDSPTNSRIRELRALSDRVFFTADNGLWVSDGTVGGTHRVTAVSNVTSYLGTTEASLYFIKNSSQLWRTDGTDAGTMLVTKVDTLGPSDATAFRSSGDTAYFARTVNGGGAIWRTDGTPDGTTKFSDRAFDTVEGLATVNGALFFATSPAQDTWELRRLGPADQASTLVKEFVGVDWPTHFTSFEGKLYFENRRLSASDLWVSDGTAEGTQPLVSAADAGSPQLIDQTFAAGDRLYVIDHGGRGSDQGYRLWESDGTAAGTRRIQNFGVEMPSQLAAIGNSLYFALHSESQGTEPWILQSTPSLPTDLNGDGHIDLADFGILKEHFGTSSALGDIDRNGKVDLGDFGLLKQAFAAPGAAALSDAALRAAAVDWAMKSCVTGDLD